MEDVTIFERIDRLADEEHRLERAHAGTGLNLEDTERLFQVETTLDQCWDLLRQRWARRNAGKDPDQAAIRPVSVVEGYQQ